MAYSTKIKEPSQDPIVLFEVDLPLENTLWINKGAGLWKKNLTPGTVIVTGSNDEEGFYGEQNTIIYFIQSMRVNNQIFSKMSSWANMEGQNKSFYYDQDTTTIHAHFDNFNPPYVYENIILGATNGWCNKVDPANDGLYNRIVYDPRIISIPDVTRKKDFLFFGLLQYAGGTVLLQNVDGELDDLKDANMLSQASRFLAGFAGDSYSDFKLFDGFFVDDYNFNFDEFRIEIADIRKRFSRTLPVAQFDATTYPDIDEKNIGENIPMPIGQVYDAPVICINDEEAGSPATYTFKLAYIGTDELTQYGVKSGQTIVVRINGEDSLDTITLNAAAGTFTLKVLNGDRGDDWVSGDYDPTKHRGKVTVDLIGYVDNGNDAIENSLDVLKPVVSEFLGIAYISDNYNTTEWAAEQVGADDIGRFIRKDLKISELIEEVCTTEDGVYLIQDDGKITFKTSNALKATSLTIYGDEILADQQTGRSLIEIDPRTSEYLSSVIIAYAKRYKENRFLKKLNNTYEQEVLNKYGRYKQRTIETLLTNSSDATTKAEAVMVSSKEIPIIVGIETGLQTSELQIFDTINAEIDRPDKTLFGMAKYEVLGVSKKLMSGQVGLTLKYAKASLIIDGLVGWWTLDDGTGTTAIDSSGYGNDGTLEGSVPTWVDGVSGKAVNLPGTNERIDCGNGAPLDDIGNGDCSFSFWMKSKDTVPLNNGMLFSKFQDGSNYIELYSFGTNNRVRLTIRKGGVLVSKSFSVDSTIFDVKLNHIIFIINRTTDKALLYFNTVKDAEEIGVSALPADISNAGNLSWGARSNGVSPYEGLLDELRVYNRALSAAEGLILFQGKA